jgi:cellulose synthase (UDP-forming)
MSRHSPRSLRRLYLVLIVLTMATLVLLTGYIGARLTTVPFDDSFSVFERLLAVALLWAEVFLCIHGVGYFMSVISVSRRERLCSPRLFAKPSRAPVAVLIAAFNESEEVLRETIASALALDYPAVRVYLLDDSTKEEHRAGAERLAEAFDIELVRRPTRDGYKAGAINDLLPRLTESYVAVLDADQRPVPSWLRDVVPLLEEDPGLAFVQAPQIYVNTAGLPVASAAAYQQAVFFEYICEGKALAEAMFCCGSNVVIRKAALFAVEKVVDGRRHFFDETSVTEDFATSINLHAAGWRTAYVNRRYVVGMAPETLPAYFTQQMRWAMGTLRAGLSLLRRLPMEPRLLTPGQWWQHLLSGTYYFVGFANFMFLITPMLFVFFDVRPLQADNTVYLWFFMGYIVFTMNMFYFGLRLRQYSIKRMWLATALSFVTFRVYMAAGLVALFGLKRAFGVTPKGVGGSIPLVKLWPELLMLAGNAATAGYGLLWMSRYGLDLAYGINTFWSFYHSILLSTLFVHFNRPAAIPERQLLLEPARAA